ncbi:MAG: cytochrome c oxidase subunit II [Planctomycetota bacterium]|nr:cytochrome c oxidase subunit II [Planctomycetota bacterium]
MTPGTQAMKNVFASSSFHTLAEGGFFQSLFFKGRGATENAAHTDDLYIWLWWFCLAWFVFLMILMTFFVIKYRRRKGQIAQVSSSHNTPLEVAWTVIPTLMLVYIFFQGFRGYMSKVVAPGEAIEINLNGQQWFWSMTYPNGAESTSIKMIGAKASPVFYMPADVPIRLRMNSRDVMHAFWITDFRTKQDVLPNRYTTMWFQAGLSKTPKMHPKDAVEAKSMDMEFIAELVGVPYEDHVVFCAEYCGNEHAEMAATIRLVPYEAWKSWLTYIESPSNKTPAEIGQFVWKTKCASCHSIDGNAGTGPTWKNLYGHTAEFTDGTSALADPNYIRESILYPAKHIVKGYGPNMPLIALKERQIEGVIAYMKTISSNPLAKEGAVEAPAKADEKK